MTAPETPAGEHLVPLEARVLRLWRLRVALVVVPAGIVLGVAVALTGRIALGAASAVVVLGGAGAVAAWWTALVWRAWQFRVGEDALHLRRGVLTRHESTIPYHRVQHIDLEAGPLERHLGLTSLILRTAAASSDSVVPGIDAVEAEVWRDRILALAGTGDAV